MYYLVGSGLFDCTTLRKMSFIDGSAGLNAEIFPEFISSEIIWFVDALVRLLSRITVL